MQAGGKDLVLLQVKPQSGRRTREPKGSQTRLPGKGEARRASVRFWGGRARDELRSGDGMTSTVRKEGEIWE